MWMLVILSLALVACEGMRWKNKFYFDEHKPWKFIAKFSVGERFPGKFTVTGRFTSNREPRNAYSTINYAIIPHWDWETVYARDICSVKLDSINNDHLKGPLYLSNEGSWS